MKKYLIASVLFLGSCVESGPKSPEPEVYKINNTSEYYNEHYNVYKLDGCEYIVVGIGDNK